MGASSPTSHLIHDLLIRRLQSSSLFNVFFSKPLFISSTISPSFISLLKPIPFHAKTTLTPPPALLCHTLSPSLPYSHTSQQQEEDDVDFEEHSEDLDNEIELRSGVSDLGETVESSPNFESSVAKLPSLTVKENKELASYAHGLGKKLKSQLVGKSGVTPGVASSFVETLEANELLKIKIHRTCPGELEDVVKQLEDVTGSVVVSQIGRTVIIYRPSISKLKAEEKRRENRRVFVRKELNMKPPLPGKGQLLRFSNRGRRGSRRV